jgi:hypothetical protein
VDIAVAVNDRVMPTGFVRSFGPRRRTDQGVKRMAGGVGVANSVEARIPITQRLPDPTLSVPDWKRPNVICHSLGRR